MVLTFWVDKKSLNITYVSYLSTFCLFVQLLNCKYMNSFHSSHLLWHQIFQEPPTVFVCLFYKSVSTLLSKWAVFGTVSGRSTCRQSKVAYHILWYNLSKCPLGWHFDGSTQSYLSEGGRGSNAMASPTAASA